MPWMCYHLHRGRAAFLGRMGARPNDILESRGDGDSRMASAAAPQAMRLSEQEAVRRDWARIRFGLGIGILAAGIGAAIMVITLLSQFDQFEGIGDIERVTPGQSFLFGLAGGISGFLVGGPFAYWLYGARPTFSRHGRRARNIGIWFLLGIAYMLFYAFLTGGIFLPAAQYFFLFLSSAISVPNIVGLFFDLLVPLWLTLGAGNGLRIIFLSAIGGALFAPCAWGVDKLSTSRRPATSKYGPISFAALIALAVIAFAAYGPEGMLEWLSQLAP